jgi:hypothetical protein
MRDDIAKVIVERPRVGGRRDKLSKQYRREVEWRRLREEGREDDSPARESMRFKYGWDRKEFNDFLSPIRGFVRKSVGRPWDDVWSEITAHLSLNSTTQRHVLEHVFDNVELHTIEQEDGEITDSRGLPLRRYRGESFYVCPSTGVLKEVPKPKPRLLPRHLRGAGIPWPHRFPAVRFHRIKGIWFEVGFSSLPVIGSGWSVGGHFFVEREKLEEWLDANWDFYRGMVKAVLHYGVVHDVVHDKATSLSLIPGHEKRHWVEGGLLYCSSKHQAGKREIRQFGLRSVVGDHAGPPAEVALAM